MAFKSDAGLVVEQAKGINNIFVKDWKPAFFTDKKKQIACIPFMRNIIEYTKGDASDEYRLLTSVLHSKPDTKSITLGNLDEVFSATFGIDGKSFDQSLVVADQIQSVAQSCLGNAAGLNFENKIVLSMAIRMAAEDFMIARIADPAFVASIQSNQTAVLFDRFKASCTGDEHEMHVLQRVMLMTPESIHLNSFMYEPIIDMSDDHLRKLYREVVALT
jgi:hypothetical protein